MNSLAIVRKFHPNVETVKDARGRTMIEVTSRDIRTAAAKSHKTCALAVACKRAKHLDGVVISRAVAYLVKGDEAIRYLLPPSTAREIVAFDRGGSFEPDTYMLIPPHDGIRIGQHRTAPRSKQAEPKKRRSPRHVTGNIRAVLGGKAR